METQQDKIEKIQEKYFDFRFENVEKELVRIRELLEQSIHDNKKNFENIYNIIEKHDKELYGLKLEQDNFSLLESQIESLKKETAFVRVMFSDPIKSLFTIGLLTLLIIIGLSIFNFEPIITFINLIKK